MTVKNFIKLVGPLMEELEDDILGMREGEEGDNEEL